MEGCHVLDLGSGAGIDCFVLSKLVGQNGHVVGVDMTQKQVLCACRNSNDSLTVNFTLAIDGNFSSTLLGSTLATTQSCMATLNQTWSSGRLTLKT